jgi:hypothetical protein
MDQVAIPDMLRITVMFGGELLPLFEIGPVSHICEEIDILLPIEVVPEFYNLVVECPGVPNQKVCFNAWISHSAAYVVCLLMQNKDGLIFLRGAPRLGPCYLPWKDSRWFRLSALVGS